MALDLFVVLIYAAGMLVLGYYGMRRAKTHEDYLVAGRNLGPSLYMGTMAATVLGGASTVGTVRLGYVHGISGFWLCAALGAGIIALNLFLAKPLLKLKIFTVTQVLEKRYNPMARQASAVIMLAYALMIGVTSILAIGTDVADRGDVDCLHLHRTFRRQPGAKRVDLCRADHHLHHTVDGDDDHRPDRAPRLLLPG
jgi:solute:Na+ symporter, SSS family